VSLPIKNLSTNNSWAHITLANCYVSNETYFSVYAENEIWTEDEDGYWLNIGPEVSDSAAIQIYLKNTPSEDLSTTITLRYEAEDQGDDRYWS